MLKLSSLRRFFRPTRSDAASALSRRDALIVSIGGAIPLLPTPAAGRVPQHIARTHVLSRAEISSLPLSSRPVVWNTAVFAFDPGAFAKATTLQPPDYIASSHPAAPQVAWSYQDQKTSARDHATPTQTK